MLDVKSTDKGMLTPRMTQAEIVAIANPANGLIVFNTTDSKFYVYIEVDGEWKEIAYGAGTLAPPALFTIGTGGSCANSIVNGTYVVGVNLDASNTVTVDANVTRIGDYTITTDTINGYSFNSSGTFITTGIVQVTLDGSGTPTTTTQTDNFIATATSIDGGTCTFNVTVIEYTYTCGDPISYEGQSYTTVQIGTQCWMAENLNIGTRIDGNLEQTQNLPTEIIEKYCYDNSTTNCDTYGGLYQWDEMMQYVSTEGTQGICPVGWHLPTDAEWKTMEMYLGMSQAQADATGWRGTDEGGKLKEIGTTHWISPNTEATNSSGFTCLPGGYRLTGGSFGYLSTHTSLWSSSEPGCV